MNHIEIPKWTREELKWNRGDERTAEWHEQRKKYGFDERETWSLFGTISRFVLPRLIAFREWKSANSTNLSDEEWDAELSAMIRAFELRAMDDSGAGAMSGGTTGQEIERGLQLFADRFRYLWW